MPESVCPVCGLLTHPLPGLSGTSLVIYYRCDACQHVWTIDKNDPALVNHVTPLPSPPKLRRR